MTGAKGKSGRPRKTTDAKLSVKKSTEKKGKAGKDPNKPKRPPSAFFVFMEGFRKQFKDQNPSNKKVSVVSKAGGEKWKSMSDAEKAPFVAKAEKLKSEYDRNVMAYNKGEIQDDNADMDGDESEKSKSEVHDEDDEGSEEEGEDND